jgi:hypothetical protein
LQLRTLTVSAYLGRCLLLLPSRRRLRGARGGGRHGPVQAFRAQPLAAERAWCARHGRRVGGQSPLGTLTEGTPHLRDKGADEVLVIACVRPPSKGASGGSLLVKPEDRAKARTNRARAKRRKACAPVKLASCSEADIRWWGVCNGAGSGRNSASLTRADLSASVPHLWERR